MAEGTPAWGVATGPDSLKEVVYTESELERRVQELGEAITGFYSDGKELLVLGLLKGSFIFLADLVRRIRRPLHVDFLVASSYGDGKVSSGEVRLLYDPNTRLRGRHVVLVEDVVDTGATMDRLIPLLQERGAESLEICALLHKRLTALEKEPRWVGFDAPDEFLVGYGLDHAENYRHLPYVASL